MEPQIKQHTIVFIGQFNPSIIHPQWLARKKIIGEAEADAATIRVNHPDISDFDLSYCTIQAVQNRFAIMTLLETHFDATRDLALLIFQNLPETNIVQLGINLNYHFQVQNQKEYSKFGHKLLAKHELWDNLLKDPALFGMQVQSARPERGKGLRNTTVGISALISQFGIDLGVNDHYELRQDQANAGAEAMVTALEDWWQASLDESQSIIEGVAQYGLT